MRINDYEHLFRTMLDENTKDNEKYISLLKVMGNNPKYDFNNQVSIAYHNKGATACAEYNFWQNTFNRVLKRGQKGITTLRQFGEYKKVVYVFDVAQTVSKDRNVNEINLWKMNKELSNNTLDNLLRKAYLPTEDFDSTISKLQAAVRHTISENYSVFANELKIEAFNQNEFRNFLEESLATSVSERLNINYIPNKELIGTHLNSFDDISFLNLGTYLSVVNKNIISTVMESEKEVLRLREQTKDSNKQYNIDDKDIKGGAENYGLRSSTRDELNYERGESVSRDERDRGNLRGNSGNSNERVEQGSTNELLRQGEIELSHEFRERELSVKATTDVSRKELNESLDGNRETSDRIYGKNETRNDEKLRDNRRTESTRPNEMGRSYEQLELDTERNDIGRNSLQLGEVEKSTSFFYSKDNPNELITDEMLERVSKMYGQEKVKASEKLVHAAYIIPFRSNWTWYMTEYDRETKKHLV